MDNVINGNRFVLTTRKSKPRLFEEGDKVLKLILPIQDKTKGKFAPN